MILFGVTILFVGELVAHTTTYFASMMALAVLFSCITYNILGALGTISGIAFCRFALSTLVISQIGKVALLQQADIPLFVPQLTITVYAVFYGCMMLGTFVFSRVRLPLPVPIEPETPSQLRILSLVALFGGLAGTAWLIRLDFLGADSSLGHGFARALAYLLPFSLVLAVNNRIQSSAGQHSFGWMALWPTLVLMFQGFLYGSRLYFVEPFAIIFLSCYFRSYRFRLKHVATAIIFCVVFFLIVSPFYLYSREFRGEASTKEQLRAMMTAATLAPSQWLAISTRVGEAALQSSGGVSYFSAAGAVTLNRFALIGPDSTLINACSTGFHYGLTSIRLDVLGQIPRFLYPNKPPIGSSGYLGHLDGQESDEFETTNSTITAISDSYGAFSWAGVVAFSFLVMPLTFVVYESIFDMRRPWGTVAAALFIFSLTEGSMGHVLTEVMVKIPAYVLILSWCATWVARLIPVSGDRAWRVRRSSARQVTSGAAGD